MKTSIAGNALRSTNLAAGLRNMALVGMLLVSTNLHASPSAPLSEQAPAWAKAMGAGAVATAEKRDGRWSYDVAGEAFDPPRQDVKAERIVFEIGSISKVFTGLLLAHALHESKLGLDDRLAQRLPVKFDDAKLGAVTLRQLATHTSCLPRMSDNMGKADPADPYARYGDAELFAYLAHAKLAATPPCESDYSNMGFGILGVVLERTYGKPWATLVHDKITAPLGMVDTATALTEEQQRRFAQPWSAQQQVRPWTFQAIAGAGALRSTLADMSRFADALLAGKRGPLGPVWPILAGDYADMAVSGGKIGLALLHNQSYGVDSYWHDGGTGGFRSELQMFPAEDRAVVVLASNANATPGAWVDQWRRPKTAAIARTEIELPAAALGDYPGVYTLAKQASFTVLRVGDGLRVRLTGQGFLPVYASARDEFFYKAVDAQLSFHRNAEGRVEGLTLHQNGRDLIARREAGAAPAIQFPDAATLADYAGEYDFGQYQSGSTIKVQVREDTVLAQLTGQPALPIFCVGKDRFEWDVVPATLTFERDASGKIVAAVLHQNGADMRAPRR